MCDDDTLGRPALTLIFHFVLFCLFDSLGCNIDVDLLLSAFFLFCFRVPEYHGTKVVPGFGVWPCDSRCEDTLRYREAGHGK